MSAGVQRAYSVLHVKSFSDEQRVISGVATTPTPDRVNDIVEPLGVQFKNPLSLLLHHDSRLPVGTVKFDKPTKDGITFTAQLPEIAEDGALKARVDEAWQSVKYGLVRGVSIGFRVLNDAVDYMKDTNGYRFRETEVMELSLVSIPANQEATIQAVKQFDTSAPATGMARVSHTPGVSGTPVVRLLPTRQEQQMKSIQEQLNSYKSTRDQKFTEQQALMTKAADEGRTLDAQESEQYDTLDTEIKSLDAHLRRLDSMQEAQKAAAVPVAGANPAVASHARGGALPTITVKDNLPAGIGMARLAIAKIMARLEGCTVSEFAKMRWPDHGQLHQYIQKATVPAGTTTNATWAGNLVDTTNLASEFIEFLRPQTIVGRIPNLRRVPFNIRVTGQTTGAVANWVGQGKGKPVTSFGTTAITLLYTKIAAIAVITEELARFSSPSAETLVRDELARAVVERMDVDFIDPAHAAVSNVNPASITNGLVALSSAGASADNVRTDLQNLLEQFLLANMNASNVVLVMPNTLALAASLLTNAFGQPEFPGIGINGGTLRGIPVVTSQYAANASGAGNLVIALDPTAIFLADDGQVTLDLSREASIEMSDAPAGDSTVPTGASLVSMFQTNSVAIRAERFINWAKARSTAVVYMDDVNWGSVGSPS